MSLVSQSDKNPTPPKRTTSTAEWIFLVVIAIIVTALILYIFLVLKNNLFTSTSPPNSDPLLNPKGCPTSDPPSNIVAQQILLTRASMDLSWDPVLFTTTQGETLLGYNIYVSKSPNIDKSTVTAIYAPGAVKRIFQDSTGAELLVNVKYYINVATVDSCGAGELLLANEIDYTPLFPLP